jgi:uncharacterized membrane protein
VSAIDALSRLRRSLTATSFVPPPGARRIEGWIAAALVAVVLLTALLFAAPLLLPANSTGDLSGRVGVVDNQAVWSKFPEPERWVYWLGDVACHTKSARSFTLNGNQMPFCARDVAIFLGMAGGLALCLSPRSRMYRFAATMPWWMFLVLLAPIALDGGAQDFLGFESDNLRRLLTGIPAGFVVALSIAFIAYEGRFALARTRVARERKGKGLAGAQPAADSPEGTSNASSGSKLVESAPMEKKNTFEP